MMKTIKACGNGVLLLLLALYLGGCDSLDESDPAGDIELAGNALVFEGPSLLALRDTTGGRYVFDAEALADNGISIQNGQVLLVADEALVRLSDVAEADGQVTATARPATLNQLIQEGTVGWEETLSFSANALPKLVAGDQVLGPSKVTATGVVFETEVNGVDLKLEITPQSGELELKLRAEKSVGGETKAALVGTGKIKQFRHASATQIAGGRTEGWDLSLDDIEVDFTIQYAAAVAGQFRAELVLPSNLELRFPIPTPLPLGVNLGIGLVALVEVNLPAALQASTQAETSFGYSGRTGFTFNGASISTSGQNSRQELDLGELGTAATQGPVDATFGVAAPRLSVYWLGNNQVAKLDNIYVTVSQLRGNPIGGLCIEIGSQQSVTGTVSLGFFGVTLAEFSHTFYENFEARDTDACPDDRPALRDALGRPVLQVQAEQITAQLK